MVSGYTGQMSIDTEDAMAKGKKIYTNGNLAAEERVLKSKASTPV